MNRRWKVAGRDVVLMMLLAALTPSVNARAEEGLPYTTYGSFADLRAGKDARYPKLVRISEPGTKESPNYTGFFFYQCLQFDPTDRYVLGMVVHCQNRDVQPTDRAWIGYTDLQRGYHWTQIGETTAWNWQQGARLQWRPGSNEILWNDRSSDGRQFVCRVWDFKTNTGRTLPRPVYALSPDGAFALTHDFQRMKHGGTPYVGIEDKYAGQYAPRETGIWKMDLNTGDATLIMSLEQMARIAYPEGAPSSGCLYCFREGWNLSGSRFIAFVKDPENGFDKAFSMTPAGTDVRYLYDRPSHHEWRDDSHILDGRGYYVYPDDGTGKAESRLFESSQNGHVSYLPRPGGDWIVSDTYDMDGYQYLFLYHIPTRQFVPLARLKTTAPDNIYRVDLHPRVSRNGRMVCIDSTHEDLGRQMYVMDIGFILDHPPGATPVARQAVEQRPSVPAPASRPFHEHLADYDAELRRPDGRVDIDALVARLKELGVTTYYWLIWHAATDWDDLKLFLPKAAEAGIDVWVYLVPPSESPPSYGSQYSEPFRLDYYRWAEEIARLSLQHSNLTAWVIDDFYANHELFTPAYLRAMQARAKGINPRLAFLPLMYFDEIRAKFAEEYREVIDGVVVAYLQDREEIEWTWAILNDAAVAAPGELSYPWNTPSKAGDFVLASQSAEVLPADRYILTFRERDDFTGPTSGYHFKQLLVDGTIVWEEDMAGGLAAWRTVTVDLTAQVRGKTSVTIAFRLLDKQGVSNFGVRWHLSELRAENLRLPAGLAEPGQWKVERQGAFEAGFGAGAASGQRRFHIPFISMTAADTGEFRQRHGDPATPERIAEWLRMSLQARRDGKCDGVVTYCLDKRPESRTFPLAQRLFREFRQQPAAQNTNQSWWLAKGLRVVTYEFLERSHRPGDLTPEEILASLDRLGGCDLVLLKGFHYWQGRFDDGSGGYPRFRSLAEKLLPQLHARGVKAGVFGFTDRERSYADGPDYGRIMDVWQEYVRLGTDILFVDEESGRSGLDIPASCLSHCDELRMTFKRPVGLFLYGPASRAEQLCAIARHVDVIGEMGYNLSLDARGDYGLEEVTRQWSQALKGVTDRPVAYWTGAMVMEPDRRPGSPFWHERFGTRTLGGYFEDYLGRARDCGADGVFFHSLCRLSGLPADAQAEVTAAVKRVFTQTGQRPEDQTVPVAEEAAPRSRLVGPLRTNPANPRYFTDGTGRAVYLTGSHTWDSLQDMGETDPPAAFDFDAYLDFLVRHEHNFIRLWRWELVRWDTQANGEKTPRHLVCTPHPWARTGPGEALDGKPKFNLEQFNEDYFRRLRARVAAARDRGIYVSVMLFEGWGLRFVPEGWKAHPFYPANNVNLTETDVQGIKGIELLSLGRPRIMTLQEAYARKVIDTVNDLDNVLYEIGNESDFVTTEWQYHMIRFIKAYESGKPKQHPVGMTSMGYGVDDLYRLLQSPADWISPSPDRYDYKSNPPAADGTKVILLDTDHLWGVGGDVPWVWKSFTRGLNPIFMDPYRRGVLDRGADTQWEPVRRAMGVTRRLADRMHLAAMTPHQELASTAYCLAAAGKEYLVYLPQGGDVTVDLAATAGAFLTEWIHLVEGTTTTDQPCPGGDKRVLTPPFSGDAVLHLRVIP